MGFDKHNLKQIKINFSLRLIPKADNFVEYMAFRNDEKSKASNAEMRDKLKLSMQVELDFESNQ